MSGNHKLNSTTQNLVIKPAACSLVIWGFHRCQRSGWKVLDSQKKKFCMKHLRCYCGAGVMFQQLRTLTALEDNLGSVLTSHPHQETQNCLKSSCMGPYSLCGHLNACSKRTTSRYTHIYHIFFKIYYRSGSGGTAL